MSVKTDFNEAFVWTAVSPSVAEQPDSKRELNAIDPVMVILTIVLHSEMRGDGP
jgi:hypothetical protein